MNYNDQLKRVIILNKTPKRIVSLVPSQTELLVDLGLGDSIVGITKFCIHPKNLKNQKVIVGGTKNIKIDKIKALNPDIILCNKEENSKAIIESLKGVAPIHISDIYNMDDTFELITQYGEIFQVKSKASDVIEAINTERDVFQYYKNKLQIKKVAYFIWKDPWMVAGSNTFIDFMIKEAGFDNVFSLKTRYPKVSLNHRLLNSIDVILLSSEPFPFKEIHVQLLKKKFPLKQILIVDGELFSWYGSRLIKSYKYFTTLY